MNVDDFAENLYEEMDKSLGVKDFNQGLHIILDHIATLKSFVGNYKFTGPEEEIERYRRVFGTAAVEATEVLV